MTSTPKLIFTSGSTDNGGTRFDVFEHDDAFPLRIEVATRDRIHEHNLDDGQRATLTLALQGHGYLTEGVALELREKAHAADLADRKLRDYGFTKGSLLARVAALCGKQGRHEAEKADMRRQWKAFKSEIHEMLAETEPPLTGELRDRIAEVCGRERNAVERIADLSEKADVLAERVRKAEALGEDVAKAAYGVRPGTYLTHTTYQQLLDRVRDLYDQTDGKEAPPLVESVRALGAAIGVPEGTRLEDVASIAVDRLAKAERIEKVLRGSVKDLLGAEEATDKECIALTERVRDLEKVASTHRLQNEAIDKVCDQLEAAGIAPAGHPHRGRLHRLADGACERVRALEAEVSNLKGRGTVLEMQEHLRSLSQTFADQGYSLNATDVIEMLAHAQIGRALRDLEVQIARLRSRPKCHTMAFGRTPGDVANAVIAEAEEAMAEKARTTGAQREAAGTFAVALHLVKVHGGSLLDAMTDEAGRLRDLLDWMDAGETWTGAKERLAKGERAPRAEAPRYGTWAKPTPAVAGVPEDGFEDSDDLVVRGQAAQREAQAEDARRRAQEATHHMSRTYFECEAQRLEARAEEHRADARLVTRKDTEAPAGVTVQAGDVTPASLVEAMRIDAEAPPLSVLARAAAASPGALSAAAWVNESHATLLVLVDEWRYDDGTIRDIAKGIKAYGGGVFAEATRSAKSYRDLVAKARAKFTVHEEPANGAVLHEADEPAMPNLGALEQYIMARAKTKQDGLLESLASIATAVGDWTESESIRRKAADSFSSWAMVELMGHRMLVGQISGDGRSLLVEDDDAETTRWIDLGAGLFATTYLRDEDEARLVRYNLAQQRRLSPPIDPALLEPREPVPAPERAPAPGGSWWLQQEDIDSLICGLRSTSDAMIAYVKHGDDDIRLITSGRVSPEMAEAARAECIRLRGDLLDDLPF